MRALADAINTMTCRLGKAVSWVTLAMVLLMFFSVIQRYIFQTNHIWQQELILFMHVIVFIVVASYTWQVDEHVRVDVCYEHYMPRTRAWVNLVGTVLLLFPVCGALIYFSYGFVTRSWEIREHSRELDGMPGVFIIKTFIWVFAGLMVLQGISTISRCISQLCATNKEV